MSMTKSPDITPLTIITTISETMQAASEAAMKSPPAFAQSYFKLHAEMLRFIGARFNAQAELFSQLCRCRDIKQMAATEEKFLGATAQDYAREVERVADVARDALNDTVTPLSGGPHRKARH